MALMLTEPKTKRKMASSAVDGGGKLMENEVEDIKNTESLNHWEFLEEIEAPMWADLSSCNLTNEDMDDQWFHISHPFHQCSSDQLISTVFHSGKVGFPNSISIQEPHSPKLPPSVSKSRGKNYKTKEWGQRRYKATSNKQHPVKSLNRKSSGSAGSSNKEKSISGTRKLKANEGPKAHKANKASKARSSCESGFTNASKQKSSKSRLSSLARQEQEHGSSSRSTITSDHSDHQQKKCLEVSDQVSTQTSGFLSSLRINLRKSCATRPAARVVLKGGRHSEGYKSSSSKSSVGSSLDQGSVGKKLTLGDAQNKIRTPDAINVMRISQPPSNKLKVLSVTKATALPVQDLSSRRGNNTFASKVTAKIKVQQHTLHRKVLMPCKVNEQYQMIDKKAASATMATCPKVESSDKAAQCLGHVQRASKQRVAQKNGSKKLIGLKEKDNRQSREDTANPARKVYFR